MEQRKNFSMIDNNVLLNENISRWARFVFCVLSSYANNKTGECFPSVPTLMRVCNMSKNTLLSALAELQKNNAIKIEKRASQNGSTLSNLYTLQWIRGGSVDEPGGFNTRTGRVQQVNEGGSMGEPELYSNNYTHLTEHTPPIAAHAAVSVSHESALTIDTQKKKPHGYTPEFEAFWNAYPRKRDKAAAFKIWERKIKNGAPARNLITAARNYALSKQGTEERYIKHASTFLNSIDPNEYQDAPTPTTEQRLHHNADGSIGMVSRAAQEEQEAEYIREIERIKRESPEIWAQFMKDKEVQNEKDNIQLHAGNVGENRRTQTQAARGGSIDTAFPF